MLKQISNYIKHHKGMKLEIKHNEKTAKKKTKKKWRLNMLLNESKKKSEEIKNILRQMKIETQHSKTYGMQQNQY